MDHHERRKQHTFMRVRDFGIEHAGDFEPNSVATLLFAEMARIVHAITAHSAAEFSKDRSAQQGTTSRAETRVKLRVALRAIRRTVKTLASDIPGIYEKFQLPASNSDRELLSAARAIAEAALPLSALLIARELPPNFLEELHALIEELDTAISEQSDHVGRRVAARAAIDLYVAKGIKTVADLDAIVKNRYAANPDILAQWRSVRHTERDARRDQRPEVGDQRSEVG